MGAKNLFHAQAGTVLCGLIKITPLFLMVMPGMISRIINADVIGCPDPQSCLKACNNENGCSDFAYPLLVRSIAPTGFKGVMVASIIAACLSGLASTSNSIGTIFTVDILVLFRKVSSDNEKVWVGRIVTVCSGLIGIVWMPILRSNAEGQLFVYLQALQSYISPAICVVFLGGILWRRASKWGGVSTILIGSLIGISRFICDIVVPPPKCGFPDERNIFVRAHFFYFALVLWIFCVFLLFIVSMLTPRLDPENVNSLTWNFISFNHFVTLKNKTLYFVKNYNDHTNYLIEFYNFITKSKSTQSYDIHIPAQIFTNQSSVIGESVAELTAPNDTTKNDSVKSFDLVDVTTVNTNREILAKNKRYWLAYKSMSRTQFIVLTIFKVTAIGILIFLYLYYSL